MTRRSLLALLLLGILVMVSCTPTNPGEPTPDINTLVAQNAQTLAAALFQTQTAMAPVTTNTPIPTVTALATSTPLSLNTPTTFIQQPVYVAATATPTGTFYTSTPLASSLGVGCKNLQLIESWTEPDSPMNPGQDFTQYWQVNNSGTCDWLYLYTYNYASGDKFGGTSSVKFGKKIEPGKWTTLSIVMHAPNNSGTYKASWRMTDGAGTQFGAVLPISVTVGGPTKTPKPDTASTAAAKTIAAGVAQTQAEADRLTAVQNAINTAVAQTQTQAAIDAAATKTKEDLCLTSPEPPPAPACP